MNVNKICFMMMMMMMVTTTTKNKSWGGRGGAVNITYTQCPLLSSLAAQPHVDRRDARTGKG